MRDDSIFQAQVSFLSPDMREESMLVCYSARNSDGAVEDAWRFARGRTRAFPDLLVKIACIKVSAYSIGGISPEGDLETRTCIPFYEWKYDAGGPEPKPA